jgi:alpha-beta hydrolase superfamily lysophospholipase
MFETGTDFVKHEPLVSVKAMHESPIPAVEHREGTFPGFDGFPLYYQVWLPAGDSRRAVVVNLHGLGDHSGLYPNLASHFPARAVALYAFDMRGNGRSPGQRAYLGSWKEYRGDLEAFVGRVREWEPDLPLFLLGNSLGGLVVLDYVLHHPGQVEGVIAAAPVLGDVGVPPVLMALGRVMSRVLPRFSLNVGMDLTGLAREPSVVEAVLADPLFHRRGTARLSTEVTAAISRVHQLAGSLSMPLLILHGSDDRMVPPDGSRTFFTKVRFPDRELREYPGAYHGLFADRGFEEVLGDLDRWIDRHILPERNVT